MWYLLNGFCPVSGNREEITKLSTSNSILFNSSILASHQFHTTFSFSFSFSFSIFKTCTTHFVSCLILSLHTYIRIAFVFYFIVTYLHSASICILFCIPTHKHTYIYMVELRWKSLLWWKQKRTFLAIQVSIHHSETWKAGSYTRNTEQENINVRERHC